MVASTGTTEGSKILGASLEETNYGHMHEGVMRAGGEKKQKSKYVKMITFCNNNEMRREDK
jgi:hypothetical protein